MAAFSILRLYTQNTEVGDFLLIWIFLTIFFKWIFVRAKYAAKQVASGKHPVASFLGGALNTEDKRTLFSLEGLLSVVMAAMATFGGMAYWNWSLKRLFTGDTFPIVLALVLGALSYGAASSRTKNNMIKLATGIFVGGLTFGLAAHSSRTDAGWSDSLLWLFLFMFVIYNLTNQYKTARGGKRAPTGGEAAGSASSDISEVKKKLKTSGGEIAKVKKTGEETVKRLDGFMPRLLNNIASLTESVRMFTARQALGTMIMAAIGIASMLFSQGASANEVRAELKKRNHSEDVIEAAIETLAPQVPPEILTPKPGAPAPAPTRVVVPSPEEIKLPSAVSEKVKKTVNVNIAQLEEAQAELQEQISKYEEIANALNNVPNSMKDCSALGLKVHGDLDHFTRAAAQLAQESKDMREVAAKTEQLHHDASHALNTADWENQQFKTSTDSFFSILSSDAGQLQRISQELKTKLQEVSKQLDIIEKNARRVQKTDISVADVKLYTVSYQKLEQLLSDIEQIIAHHGDPVKTVLVSLPGISDAIEKSRKVFEQLEKDIPPLEARYSELFQEVGKIESTKAEETKKFQQELLDANKIKDDVLMLDSLVTGIAFRDIMGGAKTQFFIKVDRSDIEEIQRNAQKVLQILGDLDSERQKIISLFLKSKETDELSQLLADLRSLPLLSDLSELAKACNTARGKRLEDAGRILGKVVMQMHQHDYLEKVSDLTAAIRTTVDKIPKGAVQSA